MTFSSIRLYASRVVIIAHNIRSLHNIGAILRSAAAFGVEKVWLTGFTATPPRKEIAKVALGAEGLVPWEAGEIGGITATLRRNSYRVLGLETGGGDIAREHSEKIALVLGNEVDGIDTQTLALLDGIVSIPMCAKRSLNVSVAAGVAMYCLGKRKSVRSSSCPHSLIG